MPGTWIRMRSSPWRWIVGSRVPTSSTRRRTISTDWSMVRSSVACRSASLSRTVSTSPAPVASMSEAPTPVSETTGSASPRATSTARAMPAGSEMRACSVPSSVGTRRTVPTTFRSVRRASRRSGQSASTRAA